MFTGIIETTGKIMTIATHQITIEAGALVKKLKKGGSIAVDGICLTVTEIRGAQFSADVIPETIRATNLKNKQHGDLVNLELAMKADSRFDGHFVTGHIDGTGEIVAIKKEGNSRRLTLRISKALGRQVAAKGSIAINGVSLTVIDVKNNNVTVGLIPHTWKTTNLSDIHKGDRVNIETDILAKYGKR